MISFMLNDIIATWATRWRWLGAPRASRSSSACFAITNILRTSVELNGDRLDPSTGLAATLAALIVSGGRLIVVEISRLSAAGGAAHAGIAPMHRGHWRVK